MNICYPDTTDWACQPDSWVDALDEKIKSFSEALAWTSLQALSGYQLSLCPTAIRPCAVRCAPNLYYAAPVVGGRRFTPYIGADGGWYNCGCGQPRACSCSSLSTVVLPGNASSVTRVLIGGQVLTPNAYAVYNGNELVRTDGGDWPACQDLSAAADENGSFVVEYYKGMGPDIITNRLAGLLATEFAKACKGDTSCKLPKGVTSIVRQGVSMEIRTGLFSEGTTGIREVDAWLETVNPYKLRAPSTVMSPDTPRQPMQTWGR